MNIRKTRSGRFEARMMINGVRYTSTQPTLEDAVNWLKVLQAQEVTGALPLRITGGYRPGAAARPWCCAGDRHL